MITIKYDNQIKITTGDLNGVFTNEQLPLVFYVKNAVSKKVKWDVKLHSGMWAVYPESEMNDVVVTDNKGNFVTQYRWDVLEHGSIFYKSLWLYCKSLINQGYKPKGLVIGTHDGEFGEWVPLVRNFMSDVVLVEGSQKQFTSLKENYEHREGITLLYDLVTPDGSDVEFFEGGRGYTNTVIKRVIDYWEKEEIHSSKRTSVSINKIIEDYFTNNGNKLDWIHLDVEGLDAKLLMSINPQILPNFIIFEDFNLLENERESVNQFLKTNRYEIFTEAGISMATKIYK